MAYLEVFYLVLLGRSLIDGQLLEKCSSQLTGVSEYNFHRRF